MLLYGCMYSWWHERQMLATLQMLAGAKHPNVDQLDELLHRAAQADQPKRAVDPEERARQVAAFVAAAGGG